MGIRDAKRVPLGVPPYFLVDELARGADPADILSLEPGSLLEEYYDTYGYVYRFGHVIEQRFSPRSPTGRHLLVWRFVPIEIWCDTDPLRRHVSATIVQIIPSLQTKILAALRPLLPKTLLLLGSQRNGRRYPHTLFSLMLWDSRKERETRGWLEDEFVSNLLPPLLSHLRARILNSCTTAVVSPPPSGREHASR
jgi:hypothetical protein